MSKQGAFLYVVMRSQRIAWVAKGCRNHSCEDLTVLPAVWLWWGPWSFRIAASGRVDQGLANQLRFAMAMSRRPGGCLSDRSKSARNCFLHTASTIMVAWRGCLMEEREEAQVKRVSR